jgi:hypothetical protein
MSDFIRLNTSRSRCANCDCDEGLTLIQRRDILDPAIRMTDATEYDRLFPMFYICWKNRTISQAGKGPVLEEKS